MGYDKIKLGMSIVGDALFEKLKTSEYMKSRGYKILYASTHYEPETNTKIVQGVEVEEIVDGKPIEYRLCYEHPKKLYYVHIHCIKPSQEASELNYFIACGNQSAILEDLINLTKEIRGELSVKVKRESQGKTKKKK
jgi:hypothetical protein